MNCNEARKKVQICIGEKICCEIRRCWEQKYVVQARLDDAKKCVTMWKRRRNNYQFREIEGRSSPVLFFSFSIYGTKCQPGVAVHYCTTKMSPQQHPVTSHIFPFSFLGTISNSFRFRARCIYCNQIVMNENTLLMQFFWDSVYVSNIFLVIK